MNKIIFQLTAMITGLMTQMAWAGTAMPWEGPLENIMKSIQGPVAKAIAVIIIIVTGLTIAFSEGGGGMRKLLFVVLGLSIAFASTSFFLTFFGFSGGSGAVF